MKNKSILILAIIALSGSVLSTNVMARQGGDRPPEGQEMEMKAGMPPFMSALDLTKEQLKLLKEDKKKNHRKMIKLRAAKQETRMDLAEALDAATPNRKQVEKIAQKLADLEKQKIMQHADSIIYLKSILTAEQKQKLETIMLMQGGPEGSWHGGLKPGKGKQGRQGRRGMRR